MGLEGIWNLLGGDAGEWGGVGGEKVDGNGGQVGMWVGSLTGTESELPRELSCVCEGVVRSFGDGGAK